MEAYVFSKAEVDLQCVHVERVCNSYLYQPYYVNVGSLRVTDYDLTQFEMMCEKFKDNCIFLSELICNAENTEFDTLSCVRVFDSITSRSLKYVHGFPEVWKSLNDSMTQAVSHHVNCDSSCYRRFDYQSSVVLKWENHQLLITDSTSFKPSDVGLI